MSLESRRSRLALLTPEAPNGVMVQIVRDPETGIYGTVQFLCEDGKYESVIAIDEEWQAVKPKWIKNHGTVVVCLGNTGEEDTYLGKDGQGDIKAISSYLNKRIWQIPADVSVYVQELRTQDKSKWPKSLAEAKGRSETRWNRREIKGPIIISSHQRKATVNWKTRRLSP